MPIPFAGWAVSGHYNSVKRISKAKTPLLILHGEDDEIVPHEQGVKLYQAGNRPKRFVTLWGASHNDIQQTAADLMARALVEFRDGLATGDVAPGYTPLMISALNFNEFCVQPVFLDVVQYLRERGVGVPSFIADAGYASVSRCRRSLSSTSAAATLNWLRILSASERAIRPLLLKARNFR